MHLLDILWHKPILNVLLNYCDFDLPTILRLSATCKSLYHEWIKIVEQVYPIERVLNTIYWQRNIPSITTLRNIVACSYQHCLYKPGLFKCVRCGVIEYQARLINFEISKHAMCYVCFSGQTIYMSMYWKYKRCKQYIHIITNSKRLSERTFNEWFSKNSIPLFEHSGQDYAKIDYWVVKSSKVVEKYSQKERKRPRKKRK